jgi:hypothetical protein
MYTVLGVYAADELRGGLQSSRSADESTVKRTQHQLPTRSVAFSIAKMCSITL